MFLRLMLVLAIVCVAAPRGSAQTPDTLAAWGERLFFDTALSGQNHQSCATCHDPAFGFADPRDTVAGRAVSMGDDLESFGDRNAPGLGYARFVPEFMRTADGVYRGGQFHDGRAANLAEQALGPIMNPVEMALPSAEVLAKRLGADPDHRAALRQYAGITDPSGDPDATLNAVADALAAFEKTDEFAPFTSRYDRYLRGEIALSDQEELGRVLFFSQQFTNCNQCHQLQATPGQKNETFSNYEYHNIGVPVNRAARGASKMAAGYIDQGLLANPHISDPAQAGKFKVPGLRNVAVTGPYMHNGVFADLRTVILFYNTYNTTRPARHINPETGAPFAPPEVDGTLSLAKLEMGPALDDQRIDALVAFLETLTDARYEHLLTR
ncbi:methylamine utilization protein MauG [Rhodobacteraceae bacterium]|nr:methylamine utilization protein MauG [Paracoccaceae bacterium]